MQSCGGDNHEHLYYRLPKKGEFISKDIFLQYENLCHNSKYYVLSINIGGYTRDGINDNRIVICDKHLKVVGTIMDFICLSVTDDTMYIYPASYLCMKKNDICIEDYMDIPSDMSVKIRNVENRKNKEDFSYDILNYQYNENSGKVKFVLSAKSDDTYAFFNEPILQKYNINKDTILYVANDSIFIYNSRIIKVSFNVENTKKLDIYLHCTDEKITEYKKKVFEFLKKKNVLENM